MAYIYWQAYILLKLLILAYGEMERVMGIEPTYSAWKAAALPLSYTRFLDNGQMVEGAGFEPAYAKRTDLQSVSFNHSDTPPRLFI